jgi:hypothetical protein
MSTESNYVIPAKYRRMENMHIVFWLLKDISWCLIWKVLGLIMIVPTLSIAILISYRTRKIKSELAHNLAVTFWITANAYWMISEFFEFDTIIVWNQLTGKHMAIIPFFIGIAILAWYYIIIKPNEKEDIHVATL